MATPKRTSCVEYVFGSMRASETQKKRRQGKPTTKLPTSLEDWNRVVGNLTDTRYSPEDLPRESSDSQE